MNKKIGCSYLGQVLSRAGILRIFLCLVLLQAFILVLGELPKVPSSHFLHQSEGGLHLPTEEFNMRFSWSCSPNLPQGTEPRPSAELSGSAAILGLTQLTQPQNSPGLALELSQRATGQISQSCLLAARTLLYQEFCCLARTGLSELISLSWKFFQCDLCSLGAA